MFKKFILYSLLFTLFFTPFLFAGCGDGADPASTTDTTDEQVSYETRAGALKTLEASIYQQGTHRLEKDGKLIALLETANPKLNLDKFIDTEVEVTGIIRPTTEDKNIEFISVVALTPKSNQNTEEITYKNYTDENFGFSVTYPSILFAQETRRGLDLQNSADHKKIISVNVIENNQERSLSEWLTDRYGYNTSELRKVSVSGLTGYQFQNKTGAVIYLGKGPQVFALAWLDEDKINRVRNRKYYLELIQSFSLSTAETTTDSPKTAKLGEFCGGIAGIACETDLKCQLAGAYPDAGGECASVDIVNSTPLVSAEENKDLETISATELSRGWYYGDTDSKKPGTPGSWILADSGTRAAMWRRPESAANENEIVLPETTASASSLSSDRQAVLSYLKRDINILAPEPAGNGQKWKLIQTSFADPNYVYTIYKTSEQTRRLLFVYAIIDGEVSVSAQAYARPGETRDWVVTEGVDTAFGKALTIVNASGNISAEISEGLRQFTNTHFGYSLQYPKDWYWRNVTTGHTEFSDRPFPAGLVRVTVEVVNGAAFAFDEIQAKGDRRVIYVKLSDTQSINIWGNTEDAEIIQTMAQTFRLEN